MVWDHPLPQNAWPGPGLGPSRLGWAVTVPGLLRRSGPQAGIVPSTQRRQETRGKDLPVSPRLSPFLNQKLPLPLPDCRETLLQRGPLCENKLEMPRVLSPQFRGSLLVTGSWNNA